MQYAWTVVNASILYTLAGFSFGISYLQSRRFNLAHGLVFSVAGYAAIVAVMHFSLAWFLAVAVASALVITAVIHAVPRPNLRSSPGRQLLYSFGELLLGETLLAIIFGDRVRTPRLPEATMHLGSASVATHEFEFVLVGIVVLTACEILFSTRVGVQLKALCDSSERARAAGLPSRVLGGVLLVVSGVCGGCASAGWVIRFSLEPATGLLALIPALTTALAAVSMYDFAVRPIHFLSASVLLASFANMVSSLTSWRWYGVALNSALIVTVTIHAYVRRPRFRAATVEL